MLQRIENLPHEIWGIRAIGKVSKSDYDSTMLPELDAARRDGHRLRFLYQFGPEFEGFTAGGAWEDARLGVQYLRLFERCAVVTDIDWIRTATKAAAAMMPCPVKVFANGEWNQAVAWLSAELQPSVSYRMLPDRGVLVIEPHGPLGAHDFDVLSAEADAWIESGDAPLTGIVIHARHFPGWENLGSVLRHIRFVRDHHRKIARVALSTDAAMAGIAAGLVDHFVEAKTKRYDYEDLGCAITWASGRTERAPDTETPRSAHV